MTVKLLYLWLGPVEETSFSQRQIARALGISQGAVSLSLARLRALRHEHDRKVDSRGSAELAPLPVMLLKENPTTKLVYLYLKPNDEIEVSVRQLEGLLGISHRTSAEALQRLIVLNQLEVLKQPVNAPGLYKMASI